MRPMLLRAARALVIGGVLLSVAACASASLPAKMTASPGLVPSATAGSQAYRALRVANVQGGEETNPLLASQVSDNDFRVALESSLRNIEYLAESGGAYEITASIIDLQQPLAGLNLSVTARVRYTVVPVGGGAPIIDETISTTGTAKVGESLVAVQRLQVANEYAVKANIETFVKLLESKLR